MFDVENFIEKNVDRYRGTNLRPGYKAAQVAALIRKAVCEATVMQSLKESNTVQRQEGLSRYPQQPQHWKP